MLHPKCSSKRARASVRDSRDSATPSVITAPWKGGGREGGKESVRAGGMEERREGGCLCVPCSARRESRQCRETPSIRPVVCVCVCVCV